MPSVTLNQVRRIGTKTYVEFGKTQFEFASNADAVAWAQLGEDDLNTLRRIVARVAVAKNLIPGGAGGPVNLTLTFTPAAATPITIA